MQAILTSPRSPDVASRSSSRPCLACHARRRRPPGSLDEPVYYDGRGRETPPTPSTSYAIHPPRVDYTTALASSRPRLFLAPMESLADWRFRRAFAATINGADEMVTEFLRVPDKWLDGYEADDGASVVRGIASKYQPLELCSASSATPLAVQIMGSTPTLLAAVTTFLAALQAPRIDLNCGCPANTVVGKGAGSSMLKTPELVYECVSAMVKAACVHGSVVTVKLRAGYADTGLFDANCDAAVAAGASFLTIHPRTKYQQYEGRADWKLLARAKRRLSVPIIGNGDVTTPERAKEMLDETGVNGIMVGRGAVRDPLLFHRIRASLWQDEASLEVLEDERSAIDAFLLALYDSLAFDSAEHNQINRMKQISSYLRSHNTELHAKLSPLLQVPSKGTVAVDMGNRIREAVRDGWVDGNCTYAELPSERWEGGCSGSCGSEVEQEVRGVEQEPSPTLSPPIPVLL